MTIHREGITTLIGTLLVLVLINSAVYYLLPQQTLLRQGLVVASFLFYLFVLQFFRNPSRKIRLDEKMIIAPADGTVVVIEETVENEYFNAPRRQVSIFMSPVNVHVNRNPVSGTVKFFKYHPGKYLVAWHPKSSTDNERTTIVVKMPSGAEVLFRQIAGAMARRIRWYVKEGQNVQQGSEMGFIKFGSRVDVFLPLNAKILVDINQKTIGGQTVIAELM
ncbi:MAG: phosphatidylserine decarboxylase family protein [Cytophagaceae bacterium]|nr:phosphatidylserine decarboxylase family protein [Cytophagaceae bacterium]